MCGSKLSASAMARIRSTDQQNRIERTDHGEEQVDGITAQFREASVVHGKSPDPA